MYEECYFLVKDVRVLCVVCCNDSRACLKLCCFVLSRSAVNPY